MRGALVLLCAGSGSRMAGFTDDKVLMLLAGKPVVAYSLAAFTQARVADCLVLIYRDSDQRAALSTLVQACADSFTEIIMVPGGRERKDSVLAGLEATPETCRLVFIHDAARPLIRSELLQQLATTAMQHGNACPARRVVDTIKESPLQCEGAPVKQTVRHLDRSRLWAMETPQVFLRDRILEAYRVSHSTQIPLTDDCAALGAVGEPITLVENPYPNPKLTHPSDLPWLHFLLSQDRGGLGINSSNDDR